MVLGMTIGFRLHDTLRAKRDIGTAVERSDRLEQIIDLVNEKYVDSVSSNALYGDAVKGILSHLDPHTVYIPADEVAGVNEELEGSFFGIGVEFAIVRDTIEVTNVVEGGPSEKAGLRLGDRMLRVNDTLIAGIGINSDKIIKMLRGGQKTAVALTVKGLGDGRQRKVTITRDEVPIYSIDAAIMLDAHTGYIKINRFSATTYDEFAKALKSVKKSGATALIIDLRDNPGGYLDAATSIADEFLDGKKLIVYTQGLREAKQEYTAVNDGLFEAGRLAVLVDEGSASAAEILSGAIQDWDRGIIVGRRTFGKGLVQEQFDLEDGAALRLTIARYYTPSGRSIQRSFAKGRAAYEADFAERFKSGELTGADSLTKEDTGAYYSLARHRLMHGGGGIKPDVYVPYDSGHLSAGLTAITSADELQDAVLDYYGSHTVALKSYRSIPDFIGSFHDEGAVLANYLKNLTPPERAMAQASLVRQASKDFVLAQIRSSIAKILFRANGYYAVSALSDDVVRRALGLLSSPQYDRLLIGR